MGNRQEALSLDPATRKPAKADVIRRFHEIHEWAVGQILTLAEIGLPPEQFRPFKKKVFELLHGALKDRTNAVLREMEEFSGSAVR